MHPELKLTTMRYFISVCFAVTFVLAAFIPVQHYTISGFIRDQQGSPLAGVTITEKGKNISTISAEDGGFTLNISSQHAVLIFNGIGIEKMELGVQTSEQPLSVVLKQAQSSLNEVVVSGLSVEADAGPLNPTPLARAIYNNLQGRVAGVTVGRQKKDKSGFYNSGMDQEKRSFQSNEDSSFNTEEYEAITENRFLTAAENPLSTFSIDVDGGSYSNVRRYLQQKLLPPSGAVRIEEFINYFHYEYPQPQGNDPFSINTEIGACGWNPSHELVMIGLQGKKIPTESLPASNLVFLIDVSGSMMEPEKLPLVQRSLKLLVDQLREQDRVSLVVYAGNAGLVMPSTSGSEKIKIKDAIDRLEAGGSTAGGAGIQLAYKVAEQNFIRNGNNRVILCTDGDFNVGPSSDPELDRIIEKEKKTGVFLTVLGYGMGNYKDSKMEKLADKGNGNHAYIDNENEAKKVLVNEFGGTLFTIAKDVKLQIEFNPAKVQAYRLIGYENRMLNKEDFNNDEKDAGELGSGHTVTAIYEIIPVGVANDFLEKIDPLKYQQATKPIGDFNSDELMTIKFRYKKPDAEKSLLIVHAVKDQSPGLNRTSDNFRFVSAVAEFGMLLRNSEFKQKCSFEKAYMLGKSALGNDTEGYRREFLLLIKGAESLTKKNTRDEEKETTGSR